MKRTTRLRKIAVLLQEAENALLRGELPNAAYLREIVLILHEEEDTKLRMKSAIDRFLMLKSPYETETLLRAVNALRHGLLSVLGTEPADWDFFRLTPEGELNRRPSVLPFRVYLDDLRSPFNVGSVFRTAESFGVERIYLSEGTPDPRHPRAVRTSMGTVDILPYERRVLETLRGEDGVFALEVGGTSVRDFSFPLSGTVILGSEELGVSPAGREIAAESAGRVSIPLPGLKGSLNVSVAFGILMYAWFAALTGLSIPEKESEEDLSFSFADRNPSSYEKSL